MSDTSSRSARRPYLRLPSVRSVPHPDERPHWSARIEDRKNRVVGSVLRGLGWRVRIQPFACYGTPQRIRVLAKLLYASPGTPATYHDQPVSDMRTMAVRGWRNFTGQVAPHRTVHIAIGGVEVSTRADRSGIVDAVVDVELEPGAHEVRLWTGPDNEVTADLSVFPADAPLGIVSDIDDTVMVTWLPRPMLAFWNAFVLQQSSRRVVRGMPRLYQRIAREHPEAPFVYLSTGAWNVFPVLRRFLYKNGYPSGPLLLTDWGPTNTGFFRSGRDHKDRALRRLHEQFPDTRWLLIGDDGQHDPEIYDEMASEHPEAVRGIAIRQLTEPEQFLAHGSTKPLSQKREGAAPCEVRARDGHGLLIALQRIGVLSS